MAILDGFITRHPMQSDCTRGNVHIAGPTEALSMMVTSETVPSSSSLGKRRRNRYETSHHGLPELTVRTVRGITVMGMDQACRRRAGRARAGLWGERSPQKGLVVPLLPGPEQESVINPRRRGTERGGSRPRQRGEFTIDPRWGIVSHRGRWELLCQDSRLGSRRERWKCSKTREVRRRSKSSYQAPRGMLKMGISTQFPQS